MNPNATYTQDNYYETVLKMRAENSPLYRAVLQNKNTHQNETFDWWNAKASWINHTTGEYGQATVMLGGAH